ncbi:unnamed protein product [Bemisia tabaci]|uniref:Squalene cyclase N-terminal domain-containing protein n=1 Tax=Bemisia tabaci TaxID=7038 RepID=A0A9P0AIW7_BEMTA|nr:unnamed protein product [Bemisia tabaci]
MDTDSLNRTITRATEALLHDQKPDGHWIYELETDAAITAQYLLYFHYFGETPDPILEQNLANYLRRTQLPTGGWALHTDGPMDIRPSAQAYFALKMAGDPPDAQHMTLARDAILRAGRAEAGNVFSRILFALFGIVAWDAVPMMPVEIILLPQWFPFHLSKMSYWARATIVPLLVLCAKRPLARNPRGVRIDEIFITPPSTVGLLPRRPHQSLGWFTFFRFADAFLRVLDPFSPKFLRQRAIDTAVKFVDERLNGEDGLGAAFPPILYSMIMYDVLGNHSSRDIARSALDKLLFNRIDEVHCQSCLSPVWDTVLAAQALLETRDQHALTAARRGLEWLRPRQVLDVHGD